MIYAARYCGAARGWIYLRAEYSDQRKNLQDVILQMVVDGYLSEGSGQISRGAGFLGREIDAQSHGADDVTLSSLDWHLAHGAVLSDEEAMVALTSVVSEQQPSSDSLPSRECGIIEPAAKTGVPFQLGICISGGAYICGEETALLESMEGRRPQPRHKPPFPTQSGLWGLPTLINNVETFWWAARRLESDVESFENRLWSVSGCVNDPGVYEAPLGISARELINKYAGGLLPGTRVSCWTPGGAATGVLSPSLLDLSLTPDTLKAEGSSLGTCGVVVYADPVSPKDVAAKIMLFLAQESCSQCTPCRQGCLAFAEWLAGSLEWSKGSGQKEWLEAMTVGSICGLGQAAPMTIKLLNRLDSGNLV
jgi:formate dehydrogenase